MKKKRNRKRLYASKFVGITPEYLKSFRDMDSDRRDKGFYLLVTMMLISFWNFHEPDRGFPCTQRNIRDCTGWGYSTIRRYRELLIDHGILDMRRTDQGQFRNAIIYSVNCDALGINNSRGKKKPYKVYTGDFWGLTRIALDNINENIPHQKRVKSLWLLSNMLVMGDWQVQNSEKPFIWSQRNLQEQVKWNRKTVRRYLDLLLAKNIIWRNFPGGLGVPASYVLNTEFVGIIRNSAENPTKIINLGKRSDTDAKLVQQR
jgi:hypothetical protein